VLGSFFVFYIHPAYVPLSGPGSSVGIAPGYRRDGPGIVII
jgi:hypothetical protein